jgi:hypothetical protein
MIKVVDPIFAGMPGIVATEAPKIIEKDILEYDGRMKVSGLEKFQSVNFISVVHFYSNQAEQKQNKPKGAMVLYVEFENAAKLYKALGLSVPDDEDDASMMNACGMMAKQISEAFNKALADSGQGSMILSEPDNYKNNIMQGVPYSRDQKKMLEFDFFYWKKKAIVIDLTLLTPMRK